MITSVLRSRQEWAKDEKPNVKITAGQRYLVSLSSVCSLFLKLFTTMSDPREQMASSPSLCFLFSCVSPFACTCSHAHVCQCFWLDCISTLVFIHFSVFLLDFFNVKKKGALCIFWCPSLFNKCFLPYFVPFYSWTQCEVYYQDKKNPQIWCLVDHLLCTLLAGERCGWGQGQKERLGNVQVSWQQRPDSDNTPWLSQWLNDRSDCQSMAGMRKKECIQEQKKKNRWWAVWWCWQQMR